MGVEHYGSANLGKQFVKWFTQCADSDGKCLRKFTEWFKQRVGDQAKFLSDPNCGVTYAKKILEGAGWMLGKVDKLTSKLVAML